MDPLSDLLSAVRLDGAVYIHGEFTAPWCVATQYGLPSVRPKLPDSDHVVFFHLLTDGACFARLANGKDVVEVKAGDLLLLPHDDPHVLGSDLTLPVEEMRSAPPEAGGLLELRHGGGGTATRFICGYFACDRRASRALLGSLPPMLRIELGDIALGGWLADLLRLGVDEVSRADAGVPVAACETLRVGVHRSLKALRAIQRARPQRLARGTSGSVRRSRAGPLARAADARLVSG